MNRPEAKPALGVPNCALRTERSALRASPLHFFPITPTSDTIETTAKPTYTIDASTIILVHSQPGRADFGR